MNFSTWNRLTARPQVKKLKESWREVADGDMPPWFYVGVHRDARLSADDRAALRQWALGTAGQTEDKKGQ